MKTFTYGKTNTIHRTKLVNVEVDSKTGEVVSVWFRCLALPFDVTKVDKNRVKEMKEMSKRNTTKIDAIVVEVEE